MRQSGQVRQPTSDLSVTSGLRNAVGDPGGVSGSLAPPVAKPPGAGSAHREAPAAPRTTLTNVPNLNRRFKIKKRWTVLARS